MILAIVIFSVGLMLSAFFSGSETGLYRVSRTRLVLDGLSGSRMARGVVWLLNHPAIFVATMLVGNNIANYLVSLAVVMAAVALFEQGSSAELIGPILMTPVVFVLGELLPKYLFFHAPYRLIRATRPALLLATVLFAPVTILLGFLGNALRMVTGETPFRVRLVMARGELDQVLRDGHEAGILAASQRVLALNLFEVGNLPAISFGVPPQRLAVVNAPVNMKEARHQARRQNHPIILVQRGGRIIGFLRYNELVGNEPRIDIKPVIRGRITDRHLRILLRLYDAGSDVAILFDDRGEIRSIVTRRQLVQPLIK